MEKIARLETDKARLEAESRKIESNNKIIKH